MMIEINDYNYVSTIEIRYATLVCYEENVRKKRKDNCKQTSIYARLNANSRLFPQRMFASWPAPCTGLPQTTDDHPVRDE